jgi:2-haloacid dehalogenase
MADRSVIAFDLVGTLLDLSALDPTFRSMFGDSHLRQEWFSELLKLAFATTAAGRYESFSDIAEATLRVIEDKHNQKLTGKQRKEILGSLRQLPAFFDVKPGLESLVSSGYRLVILTNSAQKSAKEASKAAGIAKFFDKIFSAEDVKRLKPAPEPYHMAAENAGVKTRDLLLVAAHSWDVAGAQHAGCRTCFVRRPEQVLDQLTPKPDFIVSDLAQLAEKLAR